MLTIRSILFNIGIYLFTVFFVIVLPLFFFTPKTICDSYINLWSKFALWWVKLTCNLRYEVEGIDNIPDETSIVMAKHQSAWETIALQQILPTQTWVLKRELLWIPFFGWGLAMTQPVAIDRKAGKKALKQVIEQGKDRLDKGIWLVVFPEGTRVAHGETGNYAVGGAMLATHSGYQVVPIAHNAGKYWPKNSFVKMPGVIKVIIGPVIQSEGKKPKELNEMVKAWIESTTNSL